MTFEVALSLLALGYVAGQVTAWWAVMQLIQRTWPLPAQVSRPGRERKSK